MITRLQAQPWTIQTAIYLRTVIGYCAHQVYLRAGQRQAMSTLVREADHDAVAYIVEHVEKTGLSADLARHLAMHAP